MMVKRPHLKSPHGSRNTPERCPRPLDSQHYTQEDQEIPQEDQEIPLNNQCEGLIVIKVEEAGESFAVDEESCKEEVIPPEISSDCRNTQRDVKVEEEEGNVRIKEEEVPIEISTDGSRNRNTPDRWLCVPNSTQEHQEIPLEHQGQDLNNIEVKEEVEELLLMHDEPFIEEEIPPEISAGLSTLLRHAEREENKIEHSSNSFDSETFIRLMRTHPILYEPRDPNYKNKIKRSRAWGEIGNRLWPDWSTFSAATRDRKVRAMKQKWKSIKDAFTRYRRLLREYRRGATATAPVRYLHAGVLEFLIPVIEMRSTKSSWKQPAAAIEAQPEEESNIDVDSALPSHLPPANLPSNSQSTKGSRTPLPRTGEPTTSTRSVRGRGGRRMRLGHGQTKWMEKLVEIRSSMAGNHIPYTPGVLFGLGLGHLIDRVPEHRQIAMRIALLNCIDSFLPHDQPPENTPSTAMQHGPVTHSQSTPSYAPYQPGYSQARSPFPPQTHHQPPRPTTQRHSFPAHSAPASTSATYSVSQNSPVGINEDLTSQYGPSGPHYQNL